MFASTFPSSRGAFRLASTTEPSTSFIEILPSVRKQKENSGEITEVVGTVMEVTEQWKARAEVEKAFEEIKQRTEAARRSERELRDVVNTVPAYVWRTSSEGQVDFVNDRWLQFTGLALEEALGWTWQTGLHPDDRTGVVADRRRADTNAQALDTEARV